MNLRCIYCQTPFTLARTEMLGAIIVMNEKHQSHYDAHCPRCRRANSISRQRMELGFPNWKDAAKQPSSIPEEEQAPPVPASALSKTEPLSKATKAVAAKKTAAKKAPVAKKAAASKPAGTTASKVKKAPAKSKKK